ncbi:hypothetical protein QBC35DRAFT_501851 [Podospora australis]|uniref:Aminoglycoside phosphotransferase domain-containing protein n=1 Tax=Podospora australis TaxID=1536484 RepID=A0AAN6WPZ2_9PEZI|nr:hypothetical protein QBC35DRAFT_501851 [Podospora australis]
MAGSNPPLCIYTTPLIQGVAALEMLSYLAEIDSDKETKHICFIRHLARYFARTWSAPQPVDGQTRQAQEKDISRRLPILKSDPTFNAVSPCTLSALEAPLPQLFSENHPQVLTHGDLSKTNILVDPDTYEITGMVDWSLAAVRPFGLELDTLLLTTGCMDLVGWHDYSCKEVLMEAFWTEFSDQVKRDFGAPDDRARAEVAMRIGAVVRYAFKRNKDGSASDEVSTSEAMLGILKEIVHNKNT